MSRKMIYDGGKDGKGGFVPQAGSTRGKCPSCGLTRAVARNAWDRQCRPICARCGAPLEPSRKAQAEDPRLSCRVARAGEKRRCLRCNCFLREGNGDSLCSPCRFHDRHGEIWPITCLATKRKAEQEDLVAEEEG
jgi:hypothetical protein